MKIDYEKIQALTSLCKICHNLNTTRDLQKALDTIVNSAVELIKVKGCSLKVLNERQDRLEIYSTSGLSRAFVENAGEKMFRSPLNQEAIQGKVVIVQDTQTDTRFKIPQEVLDEKIKFIVCAPMMLQEKVVGVISLYHDENREMDNSELALLKALANQSASVIESLRSFHRTETLIRVGKTINSSLDMDYILNELVKQAALGIKVKAASLRLVDESTNLVVFKSAYGLSQKYIDSIPRTIEQSPVDQEVLNSKQVVAIYDMTEEPRILMAKQAREEGIASMVCAPLTIQDKSIGILKIYSAKPTHFTEEEKNFLNALAEMGAVAIRNASLYEKLHSMFEVTKSLSFTLDLDKVLALITMHATNYLKAKGSQIFLWDVERHKFNMKSSFHLNEEFSQLVPMESIWATQETLEGNTVIMEDMNQDQRSAFSDAMRKEDVQSFLSVPLTVMERVIGILQVYHRAPRRYIADEIEFITSLANHGAIAIENAKLHEHFKKRYEDLVDDIFVWHDWTSHVVRE